MTKMDELALNGGLKSKTSPYHKPNRYGDLILPETPGLGIELNEEAAANYPFKPFDRPVIIQRDDGIGLE
jgi:hypothetical protein